MVLSNIRSFYRSEIQAIGYALPIFPIIMLVVPLGILQGIFAKYYSIELSALALIILCSRIFDAVSDPMIGYLSDRYRAKHGTRKPFMISGALLMLVCGFFLYAPFVEVTASYIAISFFAFYIALTLFEVPHITWPCDVEDQSANRTKFYSYRTLANYCGLALFYSIPLLPIFPTNEITPETLKMTFFVIVSLALPALFISMRVVPSGQAPVTTQTSRPQQRWLMLRSVLQEIYNNKPVLIFAAATFFLYFSIGMWYGLIYTYVDAYLHMGDQFAKMFLIAFLVGIVVAPIWGRITMKFGKKFTFVITTTMLIVSYLYTGWLDPDSVTSTKLLLFKIGQTLGFAGSSIVIPSMLSDIVDYAHWKTKVERNATYFSVKVFIEKSATALGIALALAIAAWFGFVVSDSSFSTESINGLKFAIAWLPAALAIVSLFFMVIIPINEQRHDIIKRRLASRLARLSASEQQLKHSQGT